MAHDLRKIKIEKKQIKVFQSGLQFLGIRGGSIRGLV